MSSEAVILFAGQGSRTAFSADAAKTLLEKVSQNDFATQTLKACYDAFVQDHSKLSEEEKLMLTDDELTSYTSLQDLVKPPSTLHENPIIQAITLFAQQILEYILYAAAGEEVTPKPNVAETAGFCSGILPAIAVAACPSVESSQFLSYVISAFRVAFWTALRSATYAKTIGGKQWKDSPWSLVVAGLSRQELETFLGEYRFTSAQNVHLSAILGDDRFAVAGPGKSLKLLQAQLPASTTCRPAFVHGSYHGGDAMQAVLEDVVQDVHRLQIAFPDWPILQVSVRSTIHGELLAATQPDSSLLRAALQCMLIHPVDWTSTFESSIDNSSQRLEANTDLHSTFLALGPNARSLLTREKHATTHPRLEIRSIPDKGTTAADSLQSDDIAIVGMSVNMPGCDTLEEIWNVLENGTNLAQEIPKSRFPIADYYDDDAGRKPKPRRMAAKYGNFLDQPFEFDNSFFSISPREAKSMDPQQRLLLQTTLSALENSGYAPNATSSFEPDHMGVFVGAATGDYVDNAREDIDVYYSPGTLRAFLSGRISYTFGFSGPSIVIDTACSSSLVAIYQACRALQNGDCGSALAGGVNVISSPDMYLGLARAHFLSPTGQCKPFDISADGYCRAESSVMFMLKRLSDAVADGDRIHGVVKGIAINQSGNSKSITHPDADTQASLFKDLLATSKIGADTVSVVEAHGTGTQAGDFTEVTSLQKVFGQKSGRKGPLFLSSIKGNTGHAEAASGGLGLAKLLLMLKNKSVPPQASFHQLNPRLSSIADHNIVVPTKLQDWATTSGLPRRALLNNFGAAGSNAALILEEHRSNPRSNLAVPRSSHVLNMSAKTSKALEELRSRYLTHMRQSPKQDPASLLNLCYSANARRQQYDEYRISVVGTSTQELAQRLESADISKKTAGRAQEAIVFVFSGQANLYRGMGAELFTTSPVFRKAVLACSRVLRRYGVHHVEDYLVWKDQENQDDVLAQCACFVLQYALATLWQSWGVEPQFVVGHSLGEYAAFVISGTLRLEDALMLVAKRAELMVAKCAHGASGMVACKLSTAAAQEVLAKLFSDSAPLKVVCDNTPDDCVVGGDLESLRTFLAHCKSEGIKAIQLQTPFAFHSPAMEPLNTAYRQICSTVEFASGATPLVSSYLGKVPSPSDLTSDYLPGQTQNQVKFVEAIQSLAKVAEGKRLHFVEIGHTAGTITMAKTILKDAEATYASSLRPKETAWTTVSTSLRHLYLERSSIKWNEIYQGSAAKYLDTTPQYPLFPSEFVIPYHDAALMKAPESSADHGDVMSSLYFRLSRKTLSDSTKFAFETRSTFLIEFITAHVVGGTPLCPASVYTELTSQALDQCENLPAGSVQVLTNVIFESPLVTSSNDRDSRLTVNLSQEDGRRGQLDYKFEVESGPGTVHCTGVAKFESALGIKALLRRKTAFLAKHVDSIRKIKDTAGDTFTTRMIYDIVFPRVVSYSEPFLTLKRLHVAPSGLEGYGIFQLPPSLELDKFVCHPALVDTLLHTAGFIANNKISRTQACICVQVENITVLNEELAASITGEMTVYCNLVDCEDGYIICDAYALDKSGDIVAMVEGMHFKMVALRGFQGYLARLAGTSQEQSERRAVGAKRPNAEKRQQPTQAPPVKEVQLSQDPDVVEVLQQEVRKICQVDTAIDADQDLAQLGIDSLMFIELAHTLRQKFPSVSSTELDLSHCVTFRDMENVLVSATRAPPPYKQNACSVVSDSKKAVISEVVEIEGSSASQSSDSPASSSQVSTPSEDSPLEVFESLIRDICGLAVADIDKDDSLESLGIDSLLSIELEQAFRQIGVSVGKEHGISELTVRQLETAILDQLTSQAPATQPTSKAAITNPATKLQDAGPSARRMYLFHDGSGLSQQYAKIDTLDCEVYGVASLDFASVDHSITDLRDFASRYISVLGLLDSDRDILLGGWSFGGVLASEIARQLDASGAPAKGLVLLDSPYPIDHQPMPDAIIAHVANTAFSTKSERRDCIEAQFKRNAGLLKDYNPPLDTFSIPTAMLLCRDSFNTTRPCGISYAWLDDQNYRKQCAQDWKRVVGSSLQVLEIKGNHFNMFSAGNASSVSRQLVAACDMFR